MRVRVTLLSPRARELTFLQLLVEKKQFVVTSVTFRVEIAGLRMEDWKSG